ncbi:MAG: TIGR01906 family membrane protein [Anaerolineae bacterium]|nr:TIGR01906 family membrane protein [Anaerolineae bacterium]
MNLNAMLSRKPVIFILSGLITLAVPLLLVLGSVRLIMTPLFLQFEYTRPGFPQDFYGLTTDERLRYAPFALDYLLNAEGIDFLANLDFPDGEPQYNARELRHMEDVKVITQAAFLLAMLLALITAAAGSALWRIQRGRLRMAVMNGALLTLGIIATIVVVAVVNWDFFFTRFHEVFFSSGTWRFEYSDTLIRLFPEQFWFDAALTIGGMTVLGAVVIAAAMWRWRGDM